LWWAKGRDTRPEQPELIERFHQNRADFDNFIPFYRQLEPGERHTFPASFDVRGPEREESHYPHVTTDGDCVLLRWRWGRPLNRDEYLIHSPRGLAGIPSKYRESAWGDGALKYRITPIDDTWFYMLEP
jgi:hypothetical protein